MRAIVLHKAHDLRIEERDCGEPGPGQVLLRMARGGICGSDLHYYHDGGFGQIRVREPIILGHEVSGHVEALGPGVEGLAVGDLVAVSPSRPCGDCTYCARGMQQHCLNMRFYGSAMLFPHIQGAFREMLVADAAQCIPATGLAPEAAAMAEPLAVVLHAVRLAGELLGRRVLVTGCGPIGALTILSARRAGAGEIVATDLTPAVLDHARNVGADVTLNVSEGDVLSEYRKDKGSFDVHFECSGAPQALASGIGVVRPQGVIVQLGLGGDMNVPMQQLTAKEIALRGSFRFHTEFGMAVDLMRRGLIDVSPLVTHVMPLDDAVAAFGIAGDRSRAMKTQIAFQ